MSISIEIVIVALLILANGVFAMSELAMISARKARLQPLADAGDKKAQTALEIANSPNDFLSMIQIGITLVGTFAGAFGGTTIADELAEYLKQIPIFTRHADGIALSFVVAIISFLSLILGELVPKRLALYAPEKIAQYVAIPMKALAKLSKPVVFLLSGSTNLVLKLFGLKESTEPAVTEAEIQVMVEQAAEAGVLEESEQEMVESVLSLGDRKASTIMIPRTDVAWMDVNASKEDIIELLERRPHGRYIVADGSLDSIVGAVEAKLIIQRHMRGHNINLKELVFDPAYIPESFHILDLLKRFRDEKQRLAFVMDEYGVFQGMLTHVDIFKAIVGDMPGIKERRKYDPVVNRDDGSWLLDGAMPMDEFKRHFDVENMPGDSTSSYNTIAGFILFYLERLPEVGEKFTWQNLSFEIIDMDRHRIDKIVITRVTEEPASTQD